MAAKGEDGPGRGKPLEIGRHLGHGLTWAVSTGFFLFVGWVVDGWLGTRPLLTIVGAFVGAGAGFYNLYRQLIVVPARREEERKKGGHGGG